MAGPLRLVPEPVGGQPRHLLAKVLDLGARLSAGCVGRRCRRHNMTHGRKTKCHDRHERHGPGR